MDSRMRRELDSYIMGVHLTHEEDVPHECPRCGRAWSARMLFDMGGWFYIDDDLAFCPDCGTEGKV
jgi:hypothetical protein